MARFQVVRVPVEIDGERVIAVACINPQGLVSDLTFEKLDGTRALDAIAKATKSERAAAETTVLTLLHTYDHRYMER